VVELLEWLSSIGFTSRSFEEETSFQYGRIGERVTGAAVTVADDPACRHGVGVPSPFDWEGVTRRPVTFLDEGVARGVVYDLRAAAVAGCASTGHAVGGGPFPEGTAAPAHVVLAPGDATREELLGRIERGLWVTRFHYVNGMLDPRRAVMTGLTRDGTFRVADGRVVGAVTNLRFTDSVLEAFARIGGIGRELRAVPTWWSELGAFVAPPVLVRGLVFTGRQRE
jgi:predicted Zn-dependent protease